jgi:hypothetical protein
MTHHPIDGYLVYGWPEFHALAQKLGVVDKIRDNDLTHRDRRDVFSLTLRIGELPEIEHRGTKLVPGCLDDGYGVYHWPEFQAFCKRARIAYDLLTVEISIRFGDGEPLTIFQSYKGLVDSADICEDGNDEPSIIETGIPQQSEE